MLFRLPYFETHGTPFLSCIFSPFVSFSFSVQFEPHSFKGLWKTAVYMQSSQVETPNFRVGNLFPHRRFRVFSRKVSFQLRRLRQSRSHSLRTTMHLLKTSSKSHRRKNHPPKSYFLETGPSNTMRASGKVKESNLNDLIFPLPPPPPAPAQFPF